MKKTFSIILVVAVALGLMGAPVARSAESTAKAQVFGDTFFLERLSGAAWAIQEDGSLWGWGSSPEGRDWEQWPVQVADKMFSIDRSFPYGLLAERVDGPYLAMRDGGYMLNPAKVDLGKADAAWLEKNKEERTALGGFTGFGFTVDGLSPTVTNFVLLVTQTDGSIWYAEVSIPNMPGEHPPLQTMPNKDWPLTKYDSTYPLMDNGCIKLILLQDKFFSDSLERAAVFILREDGTLWRWAFPKTFGETINVGPQKILDNVVSVQGESNCYALDRDGALWNCVGETPKKVIENVDKYMISSVTMAAIKTDGSLWTWDHRFRLQPAKMLDNVVDVQTDDYTIALKADGTLWAWGGGYYSGREERLFPVPGDMTERYTPRKIMDNVAIQGAPTNFPSSWTESIVKFDSNGGSETADQTVSLGDKLTRPVNPTRTGYTFAGWYTDVSCIFAYNFDNAVTAELTLYARWTAVIVPPPSDPNSSGGGGNNGGGSDYGGGDKGGTPGSAVVETIDPNVPLDSLNTPTSGPNIPFIDVPLDIWYLNDVMYVYEKGLMNGTAADKFSPESTLTRAMIMTILYRHAGKPDASGLSNPYNDVAAAEWYTDAIIWAAENGIVTGYGNGNFGTNDPISRQDLAVILMRYMNFMEINLSVTQQWISFADEADVAEYAMNALQSLNKLGIINGVGANEDGQTKINPGGVATRAQVAAMLHRFLEVIALSFAA
jgi:uncharacterized repeat protein (TIGR02543 family)